MNVCHVTLLLSLLWTGTLAGQSGDQTKGDGGKQEGEAGKSKAPGKLPKPAYTFRHGRVIEITFHADETQTERVVPPAEVKRRRAKGLIPKIHAEELFTATASIRPRRLAPGERGNLHVVVRLSDDIVVLATSRVSFDLFADDLPVVAGKSTVVPAVGGRDVKGLPARHHRDLLEIRTPITVDATAAHRSYPIPGHVELEVHGAGTGGLLGVFFCGVDGRMPIGPSLTSTTGTKAPPSIAPEDGSGTRRVRAAPGEGGAGSMGSGSARDGRIESRRNPRHVAGSGAVDESEATTQYSYWLFGLGGALALVLILTLVGRARR